MSDENEENREPLAREGEHVAPEFQKDHYHCPRCGVLAAQKWIQLGRRASGGYVHEDVWIVECFNCKRSQVWVLNDAIDHEMVLPVSGGGPRPHVEMPPDVREDYEEARSIVNRSPRGASALLRLAVQKLCKDLGGQGENINDDIAVLVDKGLPVEVQEALDALRVIGNNAVHPGEMDLKDDRATASQLFNLVNFIVQNRISEPSQRKKLFDMLPQKAKDAIQRRDAKSEPS
jgi:hypothetical protein